MTIVLTHVMLLFASNNVFRTFVSIFTHDTSIALFIVKSLLALESTLHLLHKKKLNIFLHCYVIRNSLRSTEITRFLKVSVSSL